MTDVIFRDPSTQATGPDADGTLSPDGDKVMALIELLFFAYRDFTGDPDELLRKDGFGRAHHRVIHFVYRNPGMRVADLLDILRITKQSLGRVLRQLIDRGYVEQREGQADRRERRLYTTPRGAELAQTLADPQRQRIKAALDRLSPEGRAAARDFLAHLVNEEDRPQVEALIAKTEPPE